MSKPSSFRIVPRAVWFFLSEDRRSYLLHLTLFLLGQAYEFVPPLLIGMMVNVLLAHQRGDSLWPLVWIIGGLAVTSAINALLRLRSRRKLGQYAVSARYRAKVWGFERLMDFSLDWHHQEGTGNKAQRILTGSEAVRDWTNFHNDFVPPFIAFVGTALACAMLAPATIVFFVLYVGGLAAIEIRFDRAAARLSQNLNASAEQASGVMVETAANILAVKALGAGQHMAGRVEQRESVTRDLGHARVKLYTGKWMWFQVHNAAAWAVFLAGLAAAVLHDVLSVGMVVAYTTYFNNMRSAAMNFTDRFQSLVERYADLSRLMPLFDHVEQRPGEEDFPLEWQALVADDVHLAFDGRPALQGLDLCVQRGERIGFAGASGSGKSTLVRLMLGLYAPQRGSIALQTGFVRTELSHIRPEVLSTNVSVVLQETELFNLSLRENITLMREVDPNLFAQACHVACLDELIARLPQGAETVVGERGYALSGGERQRVGVARALCRAPQILILDEATAALDGHTEATVMSRLLDSLPAHTTLLVVAHRLSTLRGRWRIAVMEQGRIVEIDAFDALAGHGRFADMLAQQGMTTTLA
ncbi:ABC transporter ATP-binding protein [Uliginosibacterium sp. sgz301328]|uniref:ABC transporter ATP-binding protein n=1 Tax=Uliginosibacterium sp. sgz301328 TaxID=3243764 RepID=UPI00359D23AB